MNNKVGIYDSYLDTLGGGERYCLSLAESLLKNGYDVDLFWSGDQTLLAKAETRFSLDLTGMNLVPDIFKDTPHNIDLVEESNSLTKISGYHTGKTGFLKKLSLIYKKFIITRKYNIFFYLSDWSIPLLFSKKNILHIQVPFNTYSSFWERFINRLKLTLISHVICNSHFTKNFAIHKFFNKCLVIYPPVDIDKFSVTSNKHNIILSVGRFDNILNSKKQEIMIEAFRQLCLQNKNITWKLVLAGGSLVIPEKNSYLQHLKHSALNLPVTFIVNPDFAQLQSVYSDSKIYWHAAGYDIEENIHPENTEHFGIAPVEAMASGLVPLLVSKGGLPEIIDNNINGYLWTNTQELIAKTQVLIASPDKLAKMSEAAIKKSSEFSKQHFIKEFKNILQ